MIVKKMMTIAINNWLSPPATSNNNLDRAFPVAVDHTHSLFKRNIVSSRTAPTPTFS